MSRKTTTLAERGVSSAFIRNPVIPGFILFVIALLLYANTLSHDYTQDDAIVIYDNMFTTQGIEGIPGILKNDTFYGFFKEDGKAKLVAGGRYRPVSQVMFAVEWELFEKNPFVGHLGNVLLYGILGFLLFFTLKALLKDQLDKNIGVIFSFLAVLFFVSHPIHTEVVANIKGRDEILSLLFSILSLWLVIKYFDKKQLAYLLLTVPVFLLALLSKENAITFVAVIPLAIYLFRSKSSKANVKIFVVLILTSIVFLFIRASVLGWDFGGKSMELMNNPFLKFEQGRYVELTFGERVATILYSLGKYVQLLIFPHPLSHDYYPRQIGIMELTNWRVLVSLLLYFLMVIFAVLRFRKFKIAVFGLLYYLITLSIVSNIVFPIGTNLSERFLFMPSVGFMILLALLLTKFREKQKVIIIPLSLLIFILFSYKTISRNTVWKNDFTLFTTDVKTSENSAKVNNAAGGALVTEANAIRNESRKRDMLNQAIFYLDRAIEIHPTYKNAYLIKGNAYYYQGEYVKAIASYDKVLEFAPGFEEASKNLAIAHREAGKDFGMNQNKLDKALYHLGLAVEMSRTDYETMRLYGIANALSGNFELALQSFHEAADLDPENAGAYVNLGNIYYNMGDSVNGKKYHDKARELDPEVFLKNEQ